MEAAIFIRNGLLVVDYNKSNRLSLHRNVRVEIKDDCIRVEAEKVSFDADLTEGGFDVNLITPDSIRHYKPWPWSKKLKQRSKAFVEYLKTTPVVYNSNNYVIIDSH